MKKHTFLGISALVLVALILVSIHGVLNHNKVAIDELPPMIKSSIAIDELPPMNRSIIAIDELPPMNKSTIAIDELPPMEMNVKC
ncbi:hypothetical protein [Pseudalkalibacillus salsuginis]|uniref:hypothetical protein n=1 Tax=Pseudalkalibacillus salsuginis TaxID=2910972 RepID=UPI001F1B763E|nr:hypothetical protein [Pseudalkalibacillus salsuginis]MCF6411789.1 hypothetical protein [Pseudalkalibacillus salsuginis]